MKTDCEDQFGVFENHDVVLLPICDLKVSISSDHFNTLDEKDVSMYDLKKDCSFFYSSGAAWF